MEFYALKKYWPEFFESLDQLRSTEREMTFHSVLTRMHMTKADQDPKPLKSSFLGYGIAYLQLLIGGWRIPGKRKAVFKYYSAHVVA